MAGRQKDAARGPGQAKVESLRRQPSIETWVRTRFRVAVAASNQSFCFILYTTQSERVAVADLGPFSCSLLYLVLVPHSVTSSHIDGIALND